MFFSWGGLIFDLAIVPALLWRRTRLVGYFLALTFHLANSLLWNIGIFPWFMVGATLLFFPAGTFRKSLFRRGIRRSEHTETVVVPDRGKRFTIAAIGLYLAWQLLVSFSPLSVPRKRQLD